MFYDPVAKHVVLTSGFSCDMAWRFEPFHYTDLWAYEPETKSWQDLGDLGIRNAINYGYDIESERAIFLTSAPIETWAYHPATGTVEELEPEVSPPNKKNEWHLFGAAMAYDEESDRLILFGGASRPDLIYEATWAYDYNSNTWTEMQPETSPSSRAFHQMVYDSESDRVLLWGGYPNPDNDTQMWAYDYNTNSWESFENLNGPETHFERFGMIYHPPSDRVILYAGFLEGLAGREERLLDPATWSYDFNSNQWEAIITETNPGQRMWYSMTYDQASDQIVFFGGEQTAKYTVDLTNAVWIFDFKDMQWRDVTQAHAGCT